MEAKPNTRTVLRFDRAELIADIAGYAFVAGDIIPDDAHGNHQIFDIAEEGNEELATRILNLAYSECVEKCYPFSKIPVEQDGIFDNRLVAPEVYLIELALPEEFSQTTILLLRNLIHDYMVCRVLSDWIGLTFPAGQEYWMRRQMELSSQIQRALTARRRKIRRPLAPF